MNRGVRLLLVAVVCAMFVLWPVAASAHNERPTHPPDGTGHVPLYRTSGPHAVVCKDDRVDFENRISTFAAALQDSNRQLYKECLKSGYRDLQAAIDKVSDAGTTIFVLPGVYMEGPSLQREPESCYHLPARYVKAGYQSYQILSYEQQKACPHQQNLVAAFGVKDLQIEGTGASPSDVVFDAQFQKLNVIRGDRTNGLYLRNFTAQKSTFNAVYVIEADGFVIDKVVGRWNTEYGFLSFAVDHGLFTNCEAYGNGDSGIYPGGTSDINRTMGFTVPRYAVEVTGCRSHDNTLGYSGTGGDSAWVHDNEFDHNMGGASMDSIFPNHPGIPQNHALFEHNSIHSNNSNYYGYVRDGTCAQPVLLQGIETGTVCPAVPVPVGSGIVVAGGNYDTFQNNWVFDNWRFGFVQTWLPGFVRGDNSGPAQEDTSHFNRYLSNQMGVSAQGVSLPNGVDFIWDGQGDSNCWQRSTSDKTEPVAIPTCPGGAQRLLADPNKLVVLADCSGYDLPTKTLPLGCDWFDTPQRPGAIWTSITLLAVAPAAQLIAVLVLFWLLLRRSTRPRWLANASAVAAGLGTTVLLVASDQQFWQLAPLGAAILGIAWLGAARLVPNRRLAVLTVVLGFVAILEAIDSGIVILPTPIGPVWLRLVLELVWIVWTAAALRPRSPALRKSAG